MKLSKNWTRPERGQLEVSTDYDLILTMLGTLMFFSMRPHGMLVCVCVACFENIIIAGRRSQVHTFFERDLHTYKDQSPILVRTPGRIILSFGLWHQPET